MDNGGFKQLIAWQKAYRLALQVYQATSCFPNTEKYGITSQMRGAAISVPANIAEGYNRQHRKEYVNFLGIGRGSLGELDTYLMLARDLGYLDEAAYLDLDLLRLETARLLLALIRSLESSPQSR